MDVKKLQFFDNNGYNLNFEWNDTFNCWEGSIYLPKVSVGLYTNTSIYVLEEVNNTVINNIIPDGIDIGETPYDYSTLSTNYVFPYGNGTISFKWDPLNTFVDEFFMFTFDDSYTLKETSALVYTPNDGPDCETLIVNTFDEYIVELKNEYSSKALPIHVAFMANEKYDATTYNRTLIMYYDGERVARIKFYAETIEEDERLKVWNSNLGYNITPEDTLMFYKSDIKEYMPDYKLLNEKRKELMMEGSNIYPYIGSYKAIINAIKFFGYENLNIIEYWKNVNPDDENFGKIYHSSKYSLTHKETLRIGTRNITLPNKDYKKINSLALVYSINEPTSDIDEWELPKVKEKFSYTIEEALIKLFALRKKLNKEFMPGTSKIIDIIGEASYFGIQGLTKVYDEYDIMETSRDLYINFEILPNDHPYITDNTYLIRYINYKNGEDLISDQMISDISDVTINDASSSNITTTIFDKFKTYLSNNEKCDWYKKYYRETYETYTVNKAIGNNDDYPYENDEYNYTDPRTRFSAKVILNNTSFQDMTFDECELKFNCKYSTLGKTIIDEQTNDIQYNLNHNVDTHNIKFNNIDSYDLPDRITWRVVMSKPDYMDYQFDDEYKNISLIKIYKYHNTDEFEFTRTCRSLDEFNQVFVELPYIGYYDVTMELGYDDGNGGMTRVTKKTKQRFIKVEPYQIEIKGFYYDIRELPKELQYEQSEGMSTEIEGIISNMYKWATAERTSEDVPVDASMPYYTTTGEVVNPGPYYNNNINNEWYLADNITFEISELQPLSKYTRYIKSGVDVKPYTWFLLGYEYSKITGKVNPHWTIINNNLPEESSTLEFDGKKYLTLLLKKEGNYTVKLDLEDKLGNTYSISRNIFVVDKSANYNIYQTFKKDYDFMYEQERIKELNEFYEYEIETPEYIDE